MSMTGQKMRVQGKQGVKNLMLAGNWSKTFPTKIETETKSCVFVKKLLTVSISNITYLRSMFPEEAYANRSMDGLPLKILMEKNKSKEAAILASWLVGAFEALEKKFLRELLLIIYVDPARPDVVHEMYTFKFTYPEGQVACQVLQGEERKEVQATHPDDVYKSTQQLLRSIISLTQGLGPLPSSAFLSMKLLYYDDVTPEDYEPAGFRPAENGDVQLPPGSLDLGAGDVMTGHHMVKVRVHARQIESNMKEQASIVSNTFSASASESDSEPRAAKVDQSGDREQVTSSHRVSNISCTCKNTMPDPLMLVCSYCTMQQHAACYRITEEAMLPSVHCCVDCSRDSQGSKVCTDTKLVKMSIKPAVVLTCIFRRALVAIMKEEMLDANFILEKFDLNKDIVSGILSKMEKEGTILQTGEGRFRVDRRTLELVALPKYLGIKKVEERTLQSIVEKTIELDIRSEKGEKGSKRLRDDEDEGRGSVLTSEEKLEGRRQSKRVKRSRTSEDVNLAKEA